MDYIIIGSRPYHKLKCNELIDLFDKNIRINISLPTNNNGTKYYDQMLNVHVYQNFIRLKYSLDKLIQRYKNMVYENNIIDFKKHIDQNKFNKIYCQVNDKRQYNTFLKKINCPYMINTNNIVYRAGLCAVLIKLIENKYNIILSNFSLDIKKQESYYRKVNVSSCHNILTEINIVKWLHKNNYLDATFCALEDNIIPTIDCSLLIPTKDGIEKILKVYGICVLKNYFSNETIDNINNEFDKIFMKKEFIESNKKEGCSNDERIFHVEKYSEYIRKHFSNQQLFNDIAKTYKKSLNKKTLINKITFEKDKIKNSGAGWHRDNHDCQFKTIMYLTDVGVSNGNFQWITNSNKQNIGYPKPRTPNYNTRFTDETISEILKINKCNLIDITGIKGTIILADTTYIHRGNIIKNGERRAITQYFF